MILYYKDLDKKVLSKGASVLEYKGFNDKIKTIRVMYDVWFKRYSILGNSNTFTTKRDLIDSIKAIMRVEWFKDTSSDLEVKELDLSSMATVFEVQDTKNDTFYEYHEGGEKEIIKLLETYNDVSLIREMIREKDLRIKELGLKDEIEEQYKYYNPNPELMFRKKEEQPDNRIAELGDNKRNEKIIDKLLKEYNIITRQFTGIIWKVKLNEEGAPVSFGKINEIYKGKVPKEVRTGTIWVINLYEIVNGDKISIVCM